MAAAASEVALRMASFDDDENQAFDDSPFKIDWVKLSEYGCLDLAISGLPGCKFKETWRSLDTDIEAIKKEGITDVFVLCTRGELRKFRVPDLIEKLKDSELAVHHHPFPDGTTLSISDTLGLLDTMKTSLRNGSKCLVHCYGGFGRSGLVSLLLTLDSEMTADTAIEKVRDLRGPAAIQSVKQYNFIHEFRDKMKEHESGQGGADRSISR